MSGNTPIKDFPRLTAELEWRINRIRSGVQPLQFYYGASGWNTNGWANLTPMSEWKNVDGGSRVQFRLRASMAYLLALGNGIEPRRADIWPTSSPAFHIPQLAPADQPVVGYALTSDNGMCRMTVDTGGFISFGAPVGGSGARHVLPMQFSWLIADV